MTQSLNFWFITGVMIYFILFIYVFYFRKKWKKRKLVKIDFEYGNKTQRLMLASLILTITLIIIRHLWFSKDPLEYDPYEILLLIAAIFAALAVYKNYRRSL